MFRMTFKAVALTVASLALASAAQAQAPHTFVSARTGDDANPCTVAAPCRTFQQALTQVQPGGEVTALDSGDYEPFSVTKSATVQAAPGVYAVIASTFASAVAINAGANDVVVVRNLTLKGPGGQAQGVGFGSGKAASVEGCVIDGFSNGIQFTHSGQLFVSDTVVRNCSTGISMYSGKATVDRCRLLKNSSGLRVSDAGKVTVRDTVAAGNNTGLRTIATAAGGTAEINIENSLVTDNLTGVKAEAISGTTALIRVANTTVTSNGLGVGVAGAGTTHLLSRGDNTVEGNATNGSFTGTFAAK